MSKAFNTQKSENSKRLDKPGGENQRGKQNNPRGGRKNRYLTR